MKICHLTMAALLLIACNTEKRASSKSNTALPSKQATAPHTRATPNRAKPNLTALKAAARKMFDAMLRGDVKAFISHSYPGLVKLAGGKDVLLLAIRSAFADYKKSGYVIKSVSLGEPKSPVKAGAELHALLPATMIMRTPKGVLRVQSHMLAVSDDGGQTWSFVDTAELTPSRVKKIFPSWNPKLKIPPFKQPTPVAKP